MAQPRCATKMAWNCAAKGFCEARANLRSGPEQSGLVFWPMCASACFATFGGRHEYFCVSETPAFSQPDTSAPVVGSAETAHATGQDQRGIRATECHPRIRLREGGLSGRVERRFA